MTVSCLRLGESEYVLVDSPAVHPLGTLLIGFCDDDILSSAAELIRHWRVSPWCPTALVSARTTTRSTIDVLGPAAMHVATFESSALPPPSMLREAVVRRTVPDSADLAAYLAFRTSSRIAALFTSVLEGDGATRSLRRSGRRIGRWSPHEWVLIDRCVKTIAGAMNHGWNEAAAAKSAAVHVKTLSGWCRRYFNADWREVAGFGAWEPVLELALREAGYVTIG
ncbi:MAG: hypothetical protein ACREL5_08575 [Gemmatimonadales bacterium]